MGSRSRGRASTRPSYADLGAAVTITIDNNNALEHLDGLHDLCHLGVRLEIIDNAVLSLIEGRGVLQPLFGTVRIFDNGALPSCQAEALARRIGATCSLPEPDSSFPHSCTTATCSCADHCGCTGNDGPGGCGL